MFVCFLFYWRVVVSVDNFKATADGFFAVTSRHRPKPLHARWTLDEYNPADMDCKTCSGLGVEIYIKNQESTVAIDVHSGSQSRGNSSTGHVKKHIWLLNARPLFLELFVSFWWLSFGL